MSIMADTTKNTPQNMNNNTKRQQPQLPFGKQCQPLFWAVASIFVLWALQSCDSGRLFSAKKDHTAATLVDKTMEQQLSFEALSIKFSLNYNDYTQEFASPGVLRIQRDSVIWVSLMPALGIEMARVLITPDSIKVMNRIRREYSVNDFGFFKQNYGVDIDFSTIQALLTNALFVYPYRFRRLEDLNNYAIIKDTAHYTLRSHTAEELMSDPYAISQKFVIAGEIYKITHCELHDHLKRRRLLFYYSDFQETNERQFPETVKIELVQPASLLVVDLDYKNISVDTPFDTPFSVPARYKRVN